MMEEESHSFYDRLLAAGALYEADEPGARELLQHALVEGGEFEQRAAVSAVLTRRADDAMLWLVDLARTHPNLERAIVEALRGAPRSDASEFLRGALSSEDPLTRVAALDAVASSGNRELLNPVQKSLHLPGDSRMVGFGAYALCALGTPPIRQLERLAASEFTADREIAAASLGYVDDAWSRLHLADLARDKHIRVRIAAAASRARLGIRNGVDVLVAMLRGEDAGGAEVAAGALRRVRGPLVLEIALEVLRGEEGPIEPSAAARVIEALGWVPESDARELLDEAVQHSDEFVQLQGLWAIGWRGRPEELALAAGALGSANPAVRATAAWAVVYSMAGGHRL